MKANILSLMRNSYENQLNSNYYKDAELSCGKPEQVADCIWDAYTDIQLFVQPGLLWLHGSGLSFTVKP